MQCTTCGDEATHKCGGCHEAFYCSQECQVKDWLEGGHEDVCGVVDALKRRGKKFIRSLRGISSHEQAAKKFTDAMIDYIKYGGMADVKGKLIEAKVDWRTAWPSRGDGTFTIRGRRVEVKPTYDGVENVIIGRTIEPLTLTGSYSEVWGKLLNQFASVMNRYTTAPSSIDDSFQTTFANRFAMFLRLFATDSNARQGEIDDVQNQWRKLSKCMFDFTKAYLVDKYTTSGKEEACILTATGLGKMLDKIQSRRKKR